MEVGWKQSLTELGNYSVDQQRYILALALQGFARDQIPREPSRQENFKIAQTALLAFQDHATYYQDKIESMRAEAVENAKKSYDEIRRLRNEGTAVEQAEYENFRQNAFAVLGLLPSPQAVAVLGHFLNDPEDRDIKQRGDVLAFPPNCGAAARALNKLGIENPPNKNVATDPRWSEFDLREVDAWKDWWHEVKAGKRTYRFIGSDVEYGPDGPASKEVIERVGRDRKRDDERANGHPKVSTASEATPIGSQISKPSSIAAAMAACALIGAAVWCFLKRRAA